MIPNFIWPFDEFLNKNETFQEKILEECKSEY